MWAEADLTVGVTHQAAYGQAPNLQDSCSGQSLAQIVANQDLSRGKSSQPSRATVLPNSNKA